MPVRIGRREYRSWDQAGPRSHLDAYGGEPLCEPCPVERTPTPKGRPDHAHGLLGLRCAYSALAVVPRRRPPERARMPPPQPALTLAVGVVGRSDGGQDIPQPPRQLLTLGVVLGQPSDDQATVLQ